MSNFRRSAYILAALVAVVCAACFVWNPPPPPKFVGIGQDGVPKQVNNFTMIQENKIDQGTKDALASADVVSRPYTDGQHVIDFMVIGGTDRSALHDPRSCLVGGGWRLENDHTFTLPGTNVVARACNALNNETHQNYEMVYVYVVDGQIVNQVTQIRAQMLLSALLGRKNRPVYFVRFMQPLEAANGDTEQQFQKFAGGMWNQLIPKMIPAQKS